MIKELIFKKVNNFWIDNGIVGLFKVLEYVKDNIIIKDEIDNIIEYEFSLNADSLKIELSNHNSEAIEVEEVHQDLFKILNEARNYLSEVYVNISTKKCRWFYKEKENEFMLFDKTSYKPHLRETFFNAKPEYEGTLYLPNTLEKETLDKKPKKINMSDIVFEKFEKFKENNKIAFNEKISAIERNVGFLNKPSKYTFGKEFSKDFVETGSKVCSFSGLKVKNTIEVNGMYSPIMTSSAGEMNFASNLQKKPQISSLSRILCLRKKIKCYI